MRTPSSFYIDNPAWPLVQTAISYWGLTTANGAAAGTTIVCADLANQPSYANMVVKLIDGNAAGQIREIITHVGTTLTVAAAFTTPLGAVSQVLASTRFIVMSLTGVTALSNAIDLIFDIVNAQLILRETGGSLTADGTEQVVVQVEAPMGVFRPTKINLDCSNMNWGDSIILRWYERIEGGGGYIQKDELQIDDLQTIPLKPIELQENRHGVRITLEQFDGAMRDFTWQYIWES